MSLIIHDVPIECINQAAAAYHIPATMIISVLKTEGGRQGMASSNKDGTYDYGPMQVNSCWLKKLSNYGITEQDLQYNPCVNVKVGAWILASNIADSRDLWTGVGNYHSHTNRFNQKYKQKVESFHNWVKAIISDKNKNGPYEN